MSLRAVLSGAMAPGMVSQGKLVTGEGQTQFRGNSWSNSKTSKKKRQYRETGTPLWNPAWGKLADSCLVAKYWLKGLGQAQPK